MKTAKHVLRQVLAIILLVVTVVLFFYLLATYEFAQHFFQAIGLIILALVAGRFWFWLAESDDDADEKVADENST